MHYMLAPQSNGLSRSHASSQERVSAAPGPVCGLCTSLLGNVTTTVSQAFICGALLTKATHVGLLLKG